MQFSGPQIGNLQRIQNQSASCCTRHALQNQSPPLITVRSSSTHLQLEEVQGRDSFSHILSNHNILSIKACALHDLDLNRGCRFCDRRHRRLSKRGQIDHAPLGDLHSPGSYRDAGSCHSPRCPRRCSAHIQVHTAEPIVNSPPQVINNS